MTARVARAAAPARPATRPRTIPADWQAIWHLLAGAGYPMARSRADLGAVALSSGCPCAVAWQSAPGRDHDLAVGAIKRTLEDAGYDLATRGAAGAAYLLVYQQFLPSGRAT